MTLSAVLTAKHNPLIDWSTTTFNNVLFQGDKMYLKALNSGLVVLEQGVEQWRRQVIQTGGDAASAVGANF